MFSIFLRALNCSHFTYIIVLLSSFFIRRECNSSWSGGHWNSDVDSCFLLICSIACHWTLFGVLLLRLRPPYIGRCFLYGPSAGRLMSLLLLLSVVFFCRLAKSDSFCRIMKLNASYSLLFLSPSYWFRIAFLLCLEALCSSFNQSFPSSFLWIVHPLLLLTFSPPPSAPHRSNWSTFLIVHPPHSWVRILYFSHSFLHATLYVIVHVPYYSSSLHLHNIEVWQAHFIV